jgi:hypothetical protein
MTDDPRTSQPTSFPDEPRQPRPGLTAAMKTKPDHGEESYVGKGVLKDKVALVTVETPGSAGRSRSPTRGRARTSPSRISSTSRWTPRKRAPG